MSEPDWNPEIPPFRKAAAEGRLAIKRCEACSQYHYYPRAVCPFCFSDRVQWVDAKGGGVVYSFSVQRRVPEPFVIAYVTLDEGPTMLTNLVDLAPALTAKIGQRVKVVFRASPEDGAPVAMFAPE